MSIVAALFIVIFGFLPVANWVPGGHQAPQYASSAKEWLLGSAIVFGVALVLTIIARRVHAVWRDGATEPLVRWTDRHPLAFGLLSAAAAFGVYLVISLRIFDAVPLSIDELVQLVQARTLAAGHLWRETAPYPEFYSAMNMVDAGGRTYAQFPIGGPAMLSLGVLVGAPWIVGPLCGAISVTAFWMFLRVAEPRRGVAIGATLLFAFAPFMAFMSGSHMNHVPTLMWLVIALAALAHVMTADRPRIAVAFVNGFALGAAATIRPVDAFAFALPAGLWYLARAIRDRGRWIHTIAAGVGVALPMCAMLWVNSRTTGSPFVFGYELLWGQSHNLGFHRAPWGVTHTPGRGLELLSLYFLRLQQYLYEASLPSLLPVAAALALAPRLRSLDRYLLASGAMIVGLYFAYWHDGFIFGPRFVFTLLPLLTLWTARLPALVRERVGAGELHRGVVYGYLVAGVLAVGVSIPIRARDYAQALMSMRLDYLGAAKRARVENALIFVRESWGSQLMARMWALGVTRSESEMLYRTVDSCMLEESMRALERTTIRDSAAYRALAPLARDSARITKSTYSPDRTEKVLPGVQYTARCVQRITDDRVGFTLLTPLLDDDWGTNVYARDMHERNRRLAALYPGRPMYLLRPRSNEIGLEPELFPISPDSARRAWADSPSVDRLAEGPRR